MCLPPPASQYLHTRSGTPAGRMPGLHSRSARPSSGGRKDSPTEVETQDRAPDQREFLPACLDCRSSAWAGLNGWGTHTHTHTPGDKRVEHSLVLFLCFDMSYYTYSLSLLDSMGREVAVWRWSERILNLNKNCMLTSQRNSVLTMKCDDNFIWFGFISWLLQNFCNTTCKVNMTDKLWNRPCAYQRVQMLLMNAADNAPVSHLQKTAKHCLKCRVV